MSVLRSISVKPLFSAIIAAALTICVSCGVDRCPCGYLQPDDTRVVYFFREAEFGCAGCDTCCCYVYWCFEEGTTGYEYLGHWDPNEQEEPPKGFGDIRQAEWCYDDWSWGCTGAPWGGCSDPSLTPRENVEAEEVAIWLSEGLVAPQQLYDKVLSDLAIIRSRYGPAIPELNTIQFTPYLESDRIIVEVTPEAAAQFERGEYHDLDSLNEHFKLCNMYPEKCCQPRLHLEFDARYDTKVLAQAYEQVPSVIGAEPGRAFGWLCRPSTVLPWTSE